jgi:hypothetical protein
MLPKVGLLTLGRMGKLHFLNTIHMKKLKLVALAYMHGW